MVTRRIAVAFWRVIVNEEPVGSCAGFLILLGSLMCALFPPSANGLEGDSCSQAYRLQAAIQASSSFLKRKVVGIAIPANENRAESRTFSFLREDN